jgi:6-phosphogluconolactonase/glucosamine-6-phosphate isomerase/deaminase
VWLSRRVESGLTRPTLPGFSYEVLSSEDAVGQAMLEELKATAAAKEGDVVIVLLGGRGAQALHRLLGQLAQGDEYDSLFSRLRVFTQDALAPMNIANAFSFVRDFERLLGPSFFAKIKEFRSMNTATDDLETELTNYVDALDSAGGIDIFFMGLGPEAGGASHLAYIKPQSGATETDVAGLIPISSSILEHHITKFKAGGTTATADDERECRAATHILTLGPACILEAKRIVQSIVDASTAPAKRESFKVLLDTELSSDPTERAKQLDENPGLWLRLHPNVRSLVLPDLLD